MKKVSIFCMLFIIALAGAVFGGASDANAVLKMTFVNKTDRTVHVATLAYVADVRTEGWYAIKPGESKTITWRDMPTHLRDSVGYYAQSLKKGANPRYWRGKKGQGPDWLLGSIHPTKKFAYPIGSGADSYTPKDAVDVTFRQITKWTVKGDTATATINLTVS